MDTCLKRAIVQLDILEPGMTYGVVVNDGRYSRDELMQLIGCYKDHYLFINEKGFKESFLKSDLLNGSWKVKGINPRKMLLEAAEKLSGIEKANVEEDLNMKAKIHMEELVQKCMKWLEEHPGEGLHIKSKFHTYNLSNPQASIARDTVLQRMNDQGKKVVIEGGRPKLLIYKGEKLTESNESEVEEAKEEAQEGPEKIYEDEFEGETVETETITNALRRVFSVEEEESIDEENKDRKFLIEKIEELQLRVIDAQEKLDRAQIRLTVEIDVYQELLDDITKHLERQEV